MTGRTVRTFLFLLAWLPLSGIGLGLLVAGWGAVSALAITPLVVPALVAFRIAVGGAARIDAELANALLGTSVRPRATSPGPRGFWRAALNVLADGAFWRQQTYLLLRLSVGSAVAVGEVALLIASLGSLALPVWYPWSGPTLGSWHVDTLPRALIGVPVGVVGLVLGIALARPIASGARYLVEALLSDAGRIEMGHHGDALRIHALAYGVVNLLMTIVWALTSRGYFWPEWTMIAFGLPLAVYAWVELVGERTPVARRPLGVHAGISAALSVFFTLIWAVTSRGYFWPVWPIVALALVLAIHAVAESARRSRRISVLEETRAGAVDQQETELERIERDLHDGAQARLVALGMSLGMAEQKLATDPVAAQELLAEARRGTREALEELRSLARGIHPPVLADRGLEAAISALGDRTPLQVNVAVDLPRRPPRAVETAAYFVAAEALANAGKHAGAASVYIAVRDDDGGGSLVVEVVDDGAGGADASGNGLRGLERRVEALDGRLEVVSPAGGPTTIRAVMPCGS